MKPYNCGDIDVNPSKRSSSVSRSVPTRSPIISPAAQNKDAKTATTPVSDVNKQPTTSLQPSSDSAPVKKDTTAGAKVGAGKPGSGPPKRTTGLAAGKDGKFKRYKLQISLSELQYNAGSKFEALLTNSSLTSES